MDLLSQYEEAGQLSVPRLLLKYYKRLNLSEEELVVLLQLKSCIDQSQSFPSVEKIAHHMQKDKNDLYQLIHQLIQKNVLSIIQGQNQSSMAQDYFSLKPLWSQLEAMIQAQDFQDQQAQEEDQEKNLLKRFEEEFGRMLSPIEIESIGQWINQDHYDVELIELALREAVLNQAYNFKYIDRILLSWEKKNIKTPQDVQAEKEKFERKKDGYYSSNQPVQAKSKVPIYNWLDDEP